MKRLILALFMIVVLASTSFALEDDLGFDESKLNEYVDWYNSNIDQIPGFIKMIIGDERANIHIKVNKDLVVIYGAITEDAKIIDFKEGEIEDPTMNIYTTSKVIKKITESKNPSAAIKAALKSKKIYYKGVGFKKLKTGLMSIGLKLYLFFVKDKIPPVDTDGDGVYDDIDICTFEPGPVDNDGCPYEDSDGDGLTDDVDECPNEPGPAENNGCPVVQCDDADPCTIDTYNSTTSRCEHRINDCDDQDACTDDMCSRGQCVHTLKVCDDQDPRTQDACNPRTGLCEHAILSNPTILEGTIVTNTNQMNQVMNVVLTEINNPINTFQTTIVLDGQGQTKDFTEDVGFNINPSNSYEITYEWVSGNKIMIIDSVVESVDIIDPIDSIMLGDGSMNTQVSVSIIFSPGGAIYGTESDDNLSGTAGDDIIYGLGGNDYISADTGDIVDGGLGIDTLVVGMSGIDLSTVSNIEIIELESVLVDLQLDHATVVALGDSNSAATISPTYQLDLLVKGSGSVSLSSDWILTGTVTYDGESFNVWENTMQVPTALLATEQSMSVALAD